MAKNLSRKIVKSHALLATVAGLMFSTLCGANVAAQNQAGAPNMEALQEHVGKARAVAGKDLMEDFYHRCYIEPLYPNSLAKLINGTAAIEPAKVFDNFYFVGQNAVSSWVIKTSQGLILIDTLNTPDEAKQYIEGGMNKLGLDPTQIKYIVITHEHADHFGGSKYLQQKYGPNGAHVLASEAAWKNMPTANRGAGLDPVRDMVIRDGQKLTLGDTTLNFYVTPGHSEGTISFTFKTSDNGKPHVVGFMGGMGSPKVEANRDKIIESYERWLKISAAAGADTNVANHQGEDHAVEYIEFLRTRRPSDPNPFVLGKDGFRRYFVIQEECAKVDLARNGQKIPQ